MREDRAFRDRLPSGAVDQIRKRIEERTPKSGERVTTSVDLPLSQDSRLALRLAAEESDALQSDWIDCGHLLLGLLRIETSAAAGVAREFGIEYASYRGALAGQHAPPPLPDSAAARPLGKPVADLCHLLNAMEGIEEHGEPRLKRAGWTRKEALGHLIDWAIAHQQWFARALSEPKLTAAESPQDAWLRHYDDLPWRELLNLCIALNRLIAAMLARRYVAHGEDIVGQLLMRG